MSILRSLLGWLVEPATERATAARHSRRESREKREEAARERAAKHAEKQEERHHKVEEAERKRQEKRREAEDAKAKKERDREEHRREQDETRRERREREERLRKERKEEKRARRTAGILRSMSGAIREKRSKQTNPKGEAGGLGRLDAGDKKCLEKAQRMSQRFHGTPDQVVELNREERQLPRFAVVIGAQRKIAYEAPADSKRAGVVWEHESGDRGAGKSPSRKAPLLLADPERGIVFTVKDKSPMRFSSRQGIVG